MSFLVWIVPFVVLLGVIVFFHELGHFLAAKRVGVKVHEFAIGFGKALFQRKHAGTLYSIRMIPLGGFVKMAGMDPAGDPDDEVSEDSDQSFNNKPIRQRMGIIAAGPLMNFALAVVLFAVFQAFVTMPITIQDVMPDSVAAEAGVRPGDEVLAVQDQPVASVEELIQTIQAHPDQAVTFAVQRDGQRHDFVVQPERDPETGQVLIGVVLSGGKERQPLGRSIVQGFESTWMVSWGLLSWLGQTVSGGTPVEEVRDNLAGPIGIAVIVGESAQQGLGYLLFLAAVINVTLGLMNLLPIPVLDGGWLVFLGIEAIRGKPLQPEHQGLAQFIGLTLLLLLMLFATYSDFYRLFSLGG